MCKLTRGLPHDGSESLSGPAIEDLAGPVGNMPDVWQQEDIVRDEQIRDLPTLGFVLQ